MAVPSGDSSHLERMVRHHLGQLFPCLLSISAPVLVLLPREVRWEEATVSTDGEFRIYELSVPQWLSTETNNKDEGLQYGGNGIFFLPSCELEPQNN